MTSRSLFLRTTFALIALGLAFATSAASDSSKKSFDLAAGSAAATLKQFVAQSGVQLLYSPEEIESVATNPVRGEMTAVEAVGQLLANTGLVATETRSGAIAINRMRDPNGDRATEKNHGRPSNTDRADDSDKKVVLETFEVFGQKTLNMDIRRSRDDVQPYVVFGRDQLEASNAVNLDDFFRTRLPMNNPFAAAPNNQSNPVATSSISLRGLSTQQTLILVDGRRAAPRISGGAGTGFLQSDINGIPFSMIERVEILPSTASGIYGGGATGGVINIITRKDYAGVELTASYANTFDSDYARRRVDLNTSFSLEGGRTQLTVSSSYTDGNQIMVRDRDLARRSLELQLANNPAAIYSATTPPTGYTPNIRNQNGSNLVLKPQYGGTALNSPITFVPVNYSGVASDNAAALVANAGKYNLELADTPNSARTGLGSAPENWSLALGARRQFGANVDAYVNYSTQHTHHQLESGGGVINVTIPVTSPSNPFTTPVTVSTPTVGHADIFSGWSETRQAVAGLAVRLPHDWMAGLDYSRSKSVNGSQQPTGTIGDPDGSGPLPSIITALQNGTLDPVRDVNRFPIDYAPFRQPKPYSYSEFEGSSQELTARAGGPVWSLPAGPITLSGSASWREDKQPPLLSENSILIPSTYTWFPAARQRVLSGYLESRVPILAENRAGWLRALELQLSTRYDNYELHTRANSASLSVPGPDGPFPNVPMQTQELDAASHTVGFKYAPLKDLTVRASYGTGFLPPTMLQITPSVPFLLSFGLTVADPKRGGVLASTGPILLNGGGRADIESEESESLSAGLVFTPQFLPGFRLSIDFTRIEKTNEIASLLPQQAFDFEDYFPGAVTRAPLTAQDQALGYTGGVVTAVRSGGFVNMARKELTAFDLQADYEMQTMRLGMFRIYAIATYQPELKTQAVIGSPLLETIGYASGGIEWRANGGIDWKRGPWSASWNVQYFDSYLGFSSTSAAPQVAAFVLNQGAALIPSQHYHDLTVGYEFRGDSRGWRYWLSHTRLTAGVQNILNTRPPILASTSVFGNFSGYGDPRLARYTLTLRKSF
jgi:iron complex outermembrane recepter protein